MVAHELNGIPISHNLTPSLLAPQLGDSFLCYCYCHSQCCC